MSPSLWSSIDLEGGNRNTIIPEGATFTPKKIHLDNKNRKLYWSDREGMRVMRSNIPHGESLVLKSDKLGISNYLEIAGIAIGLDAFI